MTSNQQIESTRSSAGKQTKIPPTSAIETAESGDTITTISPEQRVEMISVAAYYRAEKRGFTGGDPTDDWAEAAAEIDTLLGLTEKPEGRTKSGYQKKFESRLDGWDQALDRLKTDSLKLKDELRADLEKGFDALADLRTEAVEKFQEICETSESAWDDLTEGAEKTWEEMSHSLEQFTRHFKKHEKSASAKPKSEATKAKAAPAKSKSASKSK